MAEAQVERGPEKGPSIGTPEREPDLEVPRRSRFEEPGRGVLDRNTVERERASRRALAVGVLASDAPEEEPMLDLQYRCRACGYEYTAKKPLGEIAPRVMVELEMLAHQVHGCSETQLGVCDLVGGTLAPLDAPPARAVEATPPTPPVGATPPAAREERGTRV
jgi:hypothetical protein